MTELQLDVLFLIVELESEGLTVHHTEEEAYLYEGCFDTVLTTHELTAYGQSGELVAHFQVEEVHGLYADETTTSVVVLQDDLELVL